MKDYLQRIRDIREDRDIKQETIAKLLNVTQTNYSKYERGDRKLSIEQLRTLCIYFEVSADYILGLTNIPNPISKK